MNALPVKNPSPQEIIDDLITEFGIKKVIFATIARLFTRTRPPDAGTFPGLDKQPGVDDLSDRMRADIGLPPNESRRIYIDAVSLGQRFM